MTDKVLRLAPVMGKTNIEISGEMHEQLRFGFRITGVNRDGVFYPEKIVGLSGPDHPTAFDRGMKKIIEWSDSIMIENRCSPADCKGCTVCIVGEMKQFISDMKKEFSDEYEVRKG